MGGFFPLNQKPPRDLRAPSAQHIWEEEFRPVSSPRLHIMSPAWDERYGYNLTQHPQIVEKSILRATVPSLVTVNATVERCMHSHLKTFISTLTALDIHSKVIARKLTRLDTYRNILPKDLDKECQTAHVTWDDFLDTLDRVSGFSAIQGSWLVSKWDGHNRCCQQ
ncbi:hypothetical protein DV515_00006952, partial [Chloebia gouldiae]